MSAVPVLEARGLAKRFGATRALDGVDLTMRAGEVVALMGANGAGKSTLVKILSGVLRADAGTIRLRGLPFAPAGTQQAKAAGIATMHQSVAEAIVPTLSIAENLLLDRTNRGDGRWFESPAARRRAAAALAARVGLEVDPAAPAHTQPVAIRQLVTLARALDADPALLILDEPTASLSADEAERLFGALDRLRERGVAILLVSHRSGDLRRMADRALVLRDGREVAAIAAPFDYDAAVTAMIGRPLPRHAAQGGASPTNPANPNHPPGPAHHGAPPLPAGFSARGLKLFEDAPPLDFDAARGEIVAFAGPIGGGKSRLARTVFGLERYAAGAMTLDGRPWRPRGPAEAVAAGVVMLGEDRWASSLFPDSVPFASVAGTLSFPFLARWFPLGRIARRLERERAAALIRRLTIRCTGPDDRVARLSGGNQQKVALARGFAEPASLLLLDEPFQGVDVGARAEIVEVLRRGAAGYATLVFVSDPEEAFELADRVLEFDRLRIGRSDDVIRETA
ncbi:sugar ABC transporter ATP-binding protein [Burkholderia plantarii]|uniref:sugar ABC transporter ATP-binding protein n=1 Tax=Burkholderia plantarii TaxID=41899 RepID=UPI0018DD3641|nr:sugar ABC transporter ATP-binding protein [Burkholderia plantarii]MBI0329387.1 sugar ABC transporter ATP-binding protein [Burkholderia plantarii]